MPWIRRKQREGGEYFYVVLKQEGIRRGERWLYAGRTEQEAQERLKEVELSLLRNESLPGVQRGQKALYALMDDYLADCDRTLNPGTVHGYRKALTRFRDYLGRDQALKRITRKAMQDYRATLVDLAFDSQRLALGAVRAFFNWLLDAYGPESLREDFGLSDLNPAARLRLKRPPSQPKPHLSPEEIRKLLALVKKDPRDHALLLLLFSTGLRPFEALALEWKAIDFEAMNLSVVGKGGKWATHHAAVATLPTVGRP